MGLFGDISAFGAEQKRKRHEDFKKLLPLFNTWSTIEKNLSPEEKKREQTFFSNVFIWAILLFIVSSVTPYLQREDVDFWPRGDMPLYFSDDVLMAEEGFFGKSSIPTVGDIDPTEMTDVITYEVSTGDSLSLIALRFGIRVSTILANNTIPNQNSLKTGMELKILPVDGILYEVKSGDTLSGVSKKFDIDQEKIKKQNDLGEDATLIAGEEIIIPGGKKVYESSSTSIVAANPTAAYNPPSRTQTSPIKAPPTTTRAPSRPAVQAPASGNVWPVRGRGLLTQRFHVGHYGIDIADRSKPDILAMRAGTVIRASGGCRSRQTGCNSGYGNVIVIDHGGGLQTLYAHNTQFYVRKGDYVQAGQAIAKMGNTGTVYGVTGIHIHFEVRKNGKKVNPLAYVK
jgi:murein DD-endopeptidase MepM/ murein hydrolase activator NlpD